MITMGRETGAAVCNPQLKQSTRNMKKFQALNNLLNITNLSDGLIASTGTVKVGLVIATSGI